MTKIVAVTACITGVAHTFMAKSNLEKFAKKEGCDISVETQGGMGVENRLSQSEVDRADVVILAADTKVVDKERFDDKKIVQVGTSDVVKNGEQVIKEAIDKIEG